MDNVCQDDYIKIFHIIYILCNHIYIIYIMLYIFTYICVYIYVYIYIYIYMGFSDGSNGKQSTCNAGDPGSIPGA